MNKLFLFFSSRKKIIRKNGGYILIITVIISSFILTLSLGLTKILATEIGFSSDLLLAEKSYFAAESGVEQALIELKDNQTQYIDIKDSELRTGDDSAMYDLDTGNLVEENEIIVRSQETAKFRLRKDSDPNLSTLVSDMKVIDNFRISPSHGNFHWKIQCKKTVINNSKKTISIQNTWDSGMSSKQLQDLKGIYDDELGNSFYDVLVLDFFQNTNLPVDALSSITNIEDRKSCFFSIMNLETTETNTLKVLIDNANEGTMSSVKAIVKSVGRSGNKQKIISFEYLQTNLSSFFDFGFLQKD